MMMRTRSRPSPLRARRLLRGWTLRDLERATGISGSTLGLGERGELPLRGAVAQQLARVYATPLARLREEMTRWEAAAGVPAARGGGWRRSSPIPSPPTG